MLFSPYLPFFAAGFFSFFLVSPTLLFKFHSECSNCAWSPSSLQMLFFAASQFEYVPRQKGMYICVFVLCLAFLSFCGHEAHQVILFVLFCCLLSFFFSLLLFMRTTYRLLCLLLASLTFTNFGALCLLLITVYCLLVLFCLFLKKKKYKQRFPLAFSHIFIKKS